MTKLTDQYPRTGQECKFFLATGGEFIGFFDNGGALDKHSIRSSDGKGYFFEQGAEGDQSYSNIIGWEYYIKK